MDKIEERIVLARNFQDMVITNKIQQGLLLDLLGLVGSHYSDLTYRRYVD